MAKTSICLTASPKAVIKNYYFPETTIIHYKGESTKKGSINYVKVFYNAMIIFAGKHFSKGNARQFTILIKLAIYLRALLSLIGRLFKTIKLALADAFFIFLGFAILLPIWETYKFQRGYYPPEYLTGSSSYLYPDLDWLHLAQRRIPEKHPVPAYL